MSLIVLILYIPDPAPSLQGSYLQENLPIASMISPRQSTSILCPEVTVMVLRPHCHDSWHFTLRTRHFSDTFHSATFPHDTWHVLLAYIYHKHSAYKCLQCVCVTPVLLLLLASSSIIVSLSVIRHIVWVLSPSPHVALQGELLTMTSTDILPSSSGSSEARGWKRRTRRRRRKGRSLSDFCCIASLMVNLQKRRMVLGFYIESNMRKEKVF